jgi:hypothetical protein
MIILYSLLMHKVFTLSNPKKLNIMHDCLFGIENITNWGSFNEQKDITK